MAIREQEEPVGIFVYGSLKEGKRYFYMAKQAGWTHSRSATLRGYRIFSLPVGYPAVVAGDGHVYGELQTYIDLERALIVLDRFEGEGQEYDRVLCEIKTEAGPCSAWLYCFSDEAMVDERGGQLIPTGRY